MLNINFHKNEFVTRVKYSLEFLTRLWQVRTNLAQQDGVKFSSPIFQPPLSINEIFTENMRHIGTYFSHMQVMVLS